MSRTWSLYQEKDGVVEMSKICMNDEIIFLLTTSRAIQKNSRRPEQKEKLCKTWPESKSKNINANNQQDHRNKLDAWGIDET